MTSAAPRSLPLIRAICAILLSAEAGAQGFGTVVGHLVNSDSAPIAGAHLTISGTTLGVDSDARGQFRIASVPAGTRVVDVRMVGYAPQSMRFEVQSGDSVRLRLLMTAVSPAALAPVEVKSSSVALQGFEARRARGPGSFLTREDVRKMQARVFTDLMRRVSGLQVRLVNGNFGENYVVYSTRSRPCPVSFYINGSPFPVPNDTPINNYISPDEVVGVEIYAGSSEIPPQFNASANNSRCGVIVVWTRNGK